MQNLTLGQYFHSNSIIHTFDPRTKFLALFALVFIVSTSLSIIVLIMQFILLALIVVFSGIPFSVYYKQAKVFIIIIGFTFVLHSLFTDGNPLFTLPFVNLAITEEGLKLGVYFCSRLLLIIGFSLTLILTTNPTDMVNGLEKLFRPLKKIGIPSEKFSVLIGITVRFIPILFEEAERIKAAQLSRGADFKGSLKSKLNSISAMVIPLFISVFRRAENLALAMEARGYTGNNDRTYYKKLNFKSKDKIVLTVIYLFVTANFLL